jgi:UMF1 family MFS transporter
MSEALEKANGRLGRLFDWWFSRPEGEELSATGSPSATRAGRLSWALFEGARNPHVLLVTIYIFAPYFYEHVVGDPVKGQSLWGDLNAGAGFLIAIFAPMLGAVADAGGRRKPWLGTFSITLSVTAMLLFFAMPVGVGGGLPLVVICVLLVMTFVSFDFTAVFHNAMLPTMVPDQKVGKLSGLALALGNLSGVILFIYMLYAWMLPGVVDWPFIPKEPLFGVDTKAFEPERMVGIIFTVWFLIFGLPLFLFSPDQPRVRLGPIAAVTRGMSSLWKTIRSLKNYKNVGTYLVARMIYNDGCNAVLIFGGGYAATTFDWTTLDLLVYGVVLSVFATYGGIFGGWIDHKFGSRGGVLISVGGTIIGLILSLSMQPDTILFFIPYDPASPPVHSLPFFESWPEIIYVIIVIIIAIFITAQYANSRTMMARIAPTRKMAEFFGLYALSGTATAFLAPFIVARFTEWTNSNALGLASILILLTIGFVMMFFVRTERASGVEETQA